MNIADFTPWIGFAHEIVLFMDLSYLLPMVGKKIFATKRKSMVFTSANTLHPELDCWWHLGFNPVKKSPVMQICGKFQVSNNSENNIILTGVKIHDISGQILTENMKGRLSSLGAILPGTTTNLVIDLMSEKLFQTDGDNFLSDVIIKDNYDNNHKIKNVSFRCAR